MENIRVPHNAKEGFVFGITVVLISCALIGGANIYLAVGQENFVSSMIHSYLIVVLFAFLISSVVVEKVARAVTMKFYTPGDSTRAFVCFNLIVFVLIMSVGMSILGPLAGQIAECVFDGGSVDLEHIIENWRFIWPRNFCIAFWVELLVAQPIGRRVLTMVFD